MKNLKNRILAMALALLMSTVCALPALAGQTPEELHKYAVEGMLPVMDSVFRAIQSEEDGAYDAENPEFVWYVLYLVGNNFGRENEQVTDLETGLQVPAQLMAQYAAAAFSGMAQLPEIPEGVAQSVSLTEQGDYLLAASDMGDSEVKIDSYTEDEAGVVTAICGLYGSDGTDYGKMTFTMAPSENSQAMYAYEITSAA